MLISGLDLYLILISALRKKSFKSKQIKSCYWYDLEDFSLGSMWRHVRFDTTGHRILEALMTTYHVVIATLSSRSWLWLLISRSTPSLKKPQSILSSFQGNNWPFSFHHSVCGLWSDYTPHTAWVRQTAGHGERSRLPRWDVCATGLSPAALRPTAPCGCS